MTSTDKGFISDIIPMS